MNTKSRLLKALLLLKMTKTIAAETQSKIYLIHFKNTSHILDHSVNSSFKVKNRLNYTKNMHAPVYIDFWPGHQKLNRLK